MRLLALFLVLCAVLAACVTAEPKLTPAEAFPTSLHATRAGKDHFYKKENGGFETLTGIPMSKLACPACHAAKYADGTPVDEKTYTPGCKDCHKTPGDKVADSVCLGCHSRQANEIKFTTDVHREKGMACMTCHSAREMHGDGKRYVSQLEPGAMDTKCEKCHAAPPTVQAHQAHGDKLDCKACHTQTVIACNNCHLESEVAGGGRRFAAPPMTNYTFLLRRDSSGKVDTGTMQTLIYKDKTFVTVMPYGAHSVSKKGRACGDCHGSANAESYSKSGKIAVTKWNAEQSKVEPVKGVVPVPPDWHTALTFDFVTYTGNPADPKTDPKAWKFAKSGTDLRQMLYAKPLTAEQMEKLQQARK